MDGLEKTCGHALGTGEHVYGFFVVKLLLLSTMNCVKFADPSAGGSL